MLEFFRRLFSTNKTNIKRIYIAQKEITQKEYEEAPNSSNSSPKIISADKIYELTVSKKYNELKTALTAIPDNNLVLDSDDNITTAILFLSTNNESKITELEIGKLLINKIDMKTVKDGKHFDMLWTVANSGTNEIAPKIFQHLVNHGFNVNDKRTDGGLISLEEEIHRMSKTSNQEGLQTLIDNTKEGENASRFKCHLEILKIIAEEKVKPNPSPQVESTTQQMIGQFSANSNAKN